MAGETKEYLNAEADLKSALHKCRINSMVSVNEIKRWMQELDFEDKTVPLNMLTGLCNEDIIEHPQLLVDLVKAIIDFNRVIPLPSLDENTYNAVIKQRAKQHKPTHLKINEIKVPPRDWYELYIDGMQLMHQQQFRNAQKKFDETFKQLLELKTTDSNIFRVFCNAGIAYLLSGKPYLGEICIGIAKEINPKYTFAKEQLKKIKDGEFDDIVNLGQMIEMTENFLHETDPPDHLNLEKIMTWSEKKILKKLETHGIIVDREEFISTAKTVNNPEDVAEKLFYSHLPNRMDGEDFFWMAAIALWEKYCPEEPSISKWREIISSAYSDVINNTDLDRDKISLKPSEIKLLQSHLDEIKHYVFSNKKDLIKDWGCQLDIDGSSFLLRDLLTMLLMISDFSEQVLAITHKLIELIPHPDWYFITILNMIHNNAEEGNRYYETIQKQYPYYCHLAIDLGSYFIKEKDYRSAELYCMKALAIVDKRAKENMYSIDATHSTIYDDYCLVLETLEELYTKITPSKEQIKKLKNKRKHVDHQEQQLSYSPDDDRFEETISMLTREEQLHQAEESYPLQYYQFLSQFNIKFNTINPIRTEETYLPLNQKDLVSTNDNILENMRYYNGKKIGRNDPCPCGSGMKYKKCCGSVLKR